MRKGRTGNAESRGGKARRDPFQNRTARQASVDMLQQLLRLRTVAGARPAMGEMLYFWPSRICKDEPLSSPEITTR